MPFNRWAVSLIFHIYCNNVKFFDLFFEEQENECRKD